MDYEFLCVERNFCYPPIIIRIIVGDMIAFVEKSNRLIERDLSWKSWELILAERESIENSSSIFNVITFIMEMEDDSRIIYPSSYTLLLLLVLLQQWFPG